MVPSGPGLTGCRISHNAGDLHAVAAALTLFVSSLNG